MDMPISLQNDFWPSTRIAHAIEDDFTNWDIDVNLWWTIKKGVAITWENTNSVLTAWTSRSKKQEGSHSQEKTPTTKIPRGQIQIIKASLVALVGSEA